MVNGLNLFDSVSSNPFETYFYLKGISEKCGTKKYTRVPSHPLQIQRDLRAGSVNKKDLLLTILKIISYLTVLMPLLMLVGKLHYRCRHRFQVTSLEVKINRKSSPEQSLVDMGLSNRSKPNKNPSLGKNLSLLRLVFNPDFNPLNIDLNNHSMGNLRLSCEADPEAYFFPQDAIYPDKREDMVLLKMELNEAFISGKELAVLCLSYNNHRIAAVFCKDGTFKIIDSCVDNFGLVKKIADYLNRDPLSGGPSRFSGELINTHIQKGGMTCILFATLYCFHIFRTKNPEAYAELNGAFLSGRLNRFEDLDNVVGSKPVKDLAGHEVDCLPFFHSWVYRTCGFSVNHWSDLRVGELVPSNTEMDGRRGFYLLESASQRPPIWISRFDNESFSLIVMDNQVEIPFSSLEEGEIPKSGLDTPLKELLPAQPHQKHLLFFEEGQVEPRLFRLKPGQVLHRGIKESGQVTVGRVLTN